jgi:malonyl-CoA O-methyltransferase
MSAGLDARHVRRAFARAAQSYEAHAVLQREVATRLLERLDGTTLQPARVLDVGSGPGAGAAALHARYADAEVIALDLALPMLHAAAHRAGDPPAFARIAGDAQALPLADGSIDIVHSNLCLQWCDDPPRVLREFRRVVEPGGMILFSTFGPDTLMELRVAFAEVDGEPHVSRFADMHVIGDALVAQGFRDPVLERDEFVLTYADVATLMRDLRAIGATNADTGRRRSLTGKRRLAQATEAYDAFRDPDGRLPATYEVIYVQAIAPPVGQPQRGADGDDIAAFPIEGLRGSRLRGGRPR